MTDLKPIELDFKSANSNSSHQVVSLRTFDSYNFDRNILTPASALRFTAPGVDKDLRLSIRSGDTIQLFAVNQNGDKLPIGTGFVDETDTHITPSSFDYVISGRDTLGQLVDNATVDAQNKIVNTTNATLEWVMQFLLQNTRIPKAFIRQQMPNGPILFSTNPGETKINTLQRYLEFTNCLVWTQPNGQVVIGKPNFTQEKQGVLKMSFSNNKGNNLLEARVRRNLNQAIRQIVCQLSTLGQVDAGVYTNFNHDQDMREVRASLVGRSVYRKFDYGSGEDSVNVVTQVGSQSGAPRKIGNEYSLRDIAKDNMKVLDVEAVVEGHINSAGLAYNIDQIYNVQIEDEDVDEDMYVYGCSYELTKEHGMITRLRLCRKGTITAYADALQRTQ